MRYAIALLLLSSLATAAPLTLPEALNRALETNPELKAAQAEVTAARARRDADSRLIRSNPQVSAAAGPRMGDVTSLELGVEVSQPIEIGGQRGARMEAAEAAFRRAQSQYDERRADLAARTTTSFVAVLASNERLQAATRAQEVAGRSLTAARERFGAGAATQIDVNAALVEMGRAQREVTAARQRLRLARAELTLLLSAEDVEVDGTLVAVVRSLMDALPPKTDALQQRPELLAARAAVDEARGELTLSNRVAFPTPSLGVGYEREGSDQIVQGLLSFDLPLFDRNQSERATATAQVSRAEAELQVLEQRIAREVELASTRVDAAREVVSAFEQNVSAAAEENVALVQEGYREGKLDLFQVLLIQRDALETRRAYIDALEELAGAATELRRVIGAR